MPASGNGFVGIGTTAPSAKLEVNSGTTNASGLKFTQLNSSSPASSSFSQLLGLDTLGNVGLSSAGISLTSPALAYWDATANPATANASYPQASVTSLGTHAYTPNWTLANGEQLTDDNQNETGAINWNFSQVPFEEIQFQFKAGDASGNHADSTWFYSYADHIPTSEFGGAGGPGGDFSKGYLIYFSEWHKCAGISYGPYADQNQCITSGGSVGAPYPIATTPLTNIDDQNWHNVDIQILWNQIVVRWDGNVILTVADQFGRDTASLNFGFASRTGGNYNPHYIKGLLVTKLGTNTSQYYIAGANAVSPLASGLYWSNAATSPSTKTGLGALGVNVTNPSYTLEMNGTMNVHAPAYNSTGTTVSQGSNQNYCSQTPTGSVNSPTPNQTVTGVGTNWTSALIGDIITMPDGTQETITAVGSTTTMTVSGTRGICSGTYSINAPQTLMVSNTYSTLPAVNIGGMNAYAALSVNQASTGDILTASDSGTTVFRILQNGAVSQLGTSSFTTGTLSTISNTTANLTGALTGLNIDTNVGTTSDNTITGLNVDTSTIGTRGNSSVTGINIAGFTGGATGISNYGLNIGAIAGTGTSTNYGINIAGVSGGSTANYGLRIGDTAAATNYALYADGGAKSYFNGNVGIGNTTPLWKLQVTDSQAGTASAMIENTASNNNNNNGLCNPGTACHSGLNIRLGAANDATVAGWGDRFINFMIGNSKIVGKIRGGNVTGNGNTVVYDQAGGDYAEWFRKEDVNEDLPVNTLVCFTKDGNGGITKCDSTNNAIVGIISDSYGSVGNSGYEDDPSYIVAGMIGQLPVFVSTANGEIKAGDALTFSSDPGVAVKATTAGNILGHALEGYNSNGTGSVKVYLQTGWYDPNAYLTSTGSYSITPKDNLSSNPSDFVLKNSLGETIQNVGVFSEAAIANLKTGFVDAQNISTNNLTIAGQTLKDYVASNSSQENYDLSNDPLFQDLQAKTADLQTKMDVMSQRLDEQASTSAFLTEILENQIGASNSADLNLNLGNVNIQSATVSGDLMVLGRTTVSDISVTGNISTGVLTIKGLDENGTASINTLSGDLKLQNEGLGGVDILSGKVTIDMNGNVNVQNSITAKEINTRKLNIITDTSAESTQSAVLSASAGTATIAKDTDNIIINTTAVTDNSLINVTFNGDYSPAVRYWTENKIAGDSFTIKLNAAVAKDVKLNWWIVN